MSLKTDLEKLIKAVSDAEDLQSDIDAMLSCRRKLIYELLDMGVKENHIDYFDARGLHIPIADCDFGELVELYIKVKIDKKCNRYKEFVQGTYLGTRTIG